MSRYEYYRSYENYERYDHYGHHKHNRHYGNIQEFILWDRYMSGGYYPHRHRHRCHYHTRNRDSWENRYDPYHDFPYIRRYW